MTVPRPTARRVKLRLRPLRVALVAFAGLAAWIAIDLIVPRRTDFRQFDPVVTGRLDAAMWRSYYERKPAKLFWQLAQSLRVQFHAGFWSSFPIAYRAAKAAFVFKDGRSRDDYAKALPDLERYFASISRLSLTPFDARAAAQNELEWWIIRREPSRFTTDDWERLIASVAGAIYQLPPARFTDYARVRVEAMVLRDQRGNAISEQDWAHIANLLARSWGELASAVRRDEIESAGIPSGGIPASTSRAARLTTQSYGFASTDKGGVGIPEGGVTRARDRATRPPNADGAWRAVSKRS